MAANQDNRNIQVSTELGPDVLLFHRMAGRDGLSELGEYHLDLLSETPDLAIDDVLGKPLSIKVDVGPDTVREMNGIVTRFVLTGRAGRTGRYASYQATVRPWLWFLTRASDCRVFQDLDAVAIIKQIFEKYQLADYDLSLLSGTPPAMPYCVQYRETDFAFVSRLMERFGIYYYFRHAEGRHTLVLADSPAAHEPIAGSASLQYYPDAEGRARAKETVYSWQAGGEILSDEATLRDFNFETPSADLTAKSTVARNYDAAALNLELYDYPGGYGVTADGEALAKTRLESVQAGYQTIQGGATAGALAPGGLFTLADHPRADQNSQMLVVSAAYRLYSDRFEADFGKPDPKNAPMQFDCQFGAIPKSSTFRSSQRTPHPVVRGPQTAIVVGKSGEEIWTDKYGRIKVQFHWDRLGADDENSSCWVRVAQAWAGKRFGQIFIPRIGQEVVVSFLEGDPDQPLVTGSVYNATNMPPLTLPDEATRSTTKTNTSKGGGFNEIRFEDKKDNEEIFVQAEKDFNRVVKNNDTLKVGFEKADKGDQTIQINNDRTIEVGNNLSTTVKKDETRTVDGDQKITVNKTIVVEATTSIELKVGSSSIKIEPAKITIKSTQIAIQAEAAAEFKAGATMTVQSSAPMSIKSDAIIEMQGSLVKIN